MSLLKATTETLQRLIAFASISSTSNVQITDYIAQRLRPLGFDIEVANYDDAQGVTKANLLAKRMPLSSSAASSSSATSSSSGTSGSQSTRSRPGLAYFAHTDVVPVESWTGPGGDPFAAVVDHQRVHGRGACDMKGSIAAMLSAVESIPAESQQAPLWFVCTADEEVGFDGAKHLVRSSPGYREIVRTQPVAIIGEPTQLQVIHAHKGITGFQITSRGRAAHSSTADGINANIALVPMLNKIVELYQRTISQPGYRDDRFAVPTLSWNFGINDHGKAINITSPQADVWVSLRTMPEIDGEDLIAEAKATAEQLGLAFELFDGGKPVWIDANASCVQAMCRLAGGRPRTEGYSTDGGQLTELTQIVVCGPGDIAQAHTAHEWISRDQLIEGIDLYRRAIGAFA